MGPMTLCLCKSETLKTSLVRLHVRVGAGMTYKIHSIMCDGRAGGVCCPNRRGEWWVRLSVNSEHMGYPEMALEVRPV